MHPKAMIVHQTRERARLRIKEKLDDPDYFEKVQGKLSSISAITAVETNSATGSILLLHPDKPWSEVEPELRKLELFEIVEHIEQEPALSSVTAVISRFEKSISDISSGSVDLPTLAFILLFGFAIRQIMRGEIMGPGLPLLWGALDLARHIGNKEVI